MKKYLFIFLSVLILASMVLISCDKQEETTTAPSPSVTSQPTATAPATSAAKPTTAAPTSKAPEPTATVSPTKGPQEYGGTLTILYPYHLARTPGWPSDRTNNQVTMAGWTIYEPLMKLLADGTPMPWLASSWEWSSDYMNITFHLQEGVKFHDGSAFTADAVKFEAEQVIAANSAAAVTWDRWEVINDTTIRLYLKEYLNNFWTSLAGTNMMFMSLDQYNKKGQEYCADHPCGTGPFLFEAFEKDVAFRLAKNPNYWKKGLPYLDKIVYSFVVEPLTQLSALKSGDGDIAAWMQGKNLRDMQDLGYTIQSALSGSGFIMFDTANEGSVFNDVNIRKAIELCVDKEGIVAAQGYGFMVPNNQMTPPTYASYNAKLPSRSYDPKAALASLKASSQPNGFETKIITTGGAQNQALIIQECLRAININAAMDVVDNPKFWDYLYNGWANALIVTDFAIPLNFPSWLRSMFPPTATVDVSVKFSDAIVAKITPALKETDPAKAKQLSDELIQMIWDDCSYVPLFSNSMGFIQNPAVKDSGIFTHYDWSIWDPSTVWKSTK